MVSRKDMTLQVHRSRSVSHDKDSLGAYCLHLEMTIPKNKPVDQKKSLPDDDANTKTHPVHPPLSLLFRQKWSFLRDVSTI